LEKQTVANLLLGFLETGKKGRYRSINIPVAGLSKKNALAKELPM